MNPVTCPCPPDRHVDHCWGTTAAHAYLTHVNGDTP